MTRPKSICVFAGSRPGARPAYAEAARALGTALGTQGIRVVFGGGSVGLMGECADAALAAGGEVVGVIPHELVRREVAHQGLTAMHAVDTMHERKALMEDLSDAVIALPGGLGTFDELFEILTWGQLGIHAKACGLLNVDGYFDALNALVDHAVAEGFVAGTHRGLLMSEATPDALLDRMAGYEHPPVERWSPPKP